MDESVLQISSIFTDGGFYLGYPSDFFWLKFSESYCSFWCYISLELSFGCNISFLGPELG
jgi:hypothetical protein